MSLCSSKAIVQQSSSSNAVEKSGRSSKKSGKREHHLWKRRDSAGSGQKAIHLVQIVSRLPNEKEAVYRALDEWIAWELEFPLIAAAKALTILKKQRQWLRVIQGQDTIRNVGRKRRRGTLPLRELGTIVFWVAFVPRLGTNGPDRDSSVRPAFLVAKWMLSKGQGTTMATYDAVLLAYDQQSRVEEAGSLWNMILHTHTRSISKRLFSRIISLYDHHDRTDKIIEVFGEMEELGVKPDEDTVRRVAQAFERLGEEDKKNLVIDKYGCRWKYMHFKGERVKVRRNPLVD
ncbi:hypothetical protein RDABS01_036505 [Bienertia sinuspersici]